VNPFAQDVRYKVLRLIFQQLSAIERLDDPQAL